MSRPPAGASLPGELTVALSRVRWTPARVDTLIREVPKAELHLHLDGSLSPETIARLAAAQGYAPLAGRSPAEIAQLTVVAARRPSLAKVLEAFSLVLPLLRRPEAVEEASYELVRAAARSRVRWLEARFAPALLEGDGFTPEAALQAALSGLARGRSDFGVGSGVIVCLVRPESLVDMAGNRAMLDLALAYRGRGVVGVDLAGDEAEAPLSRYEPLLREAGLGGLGVTVHAGEVPGSKDLETALALGVNRLGHATLLPDQPDLEREVLRRGLPIEVNLTSNLRTSAVVDLRRHPARRWREMGIPLAVSTDDPGIFAIDLMHEYRLLHDALGFGPADLLAVSLPAVDALFLPAAERRALRRGFEDETLALLGRLAGEDD